MTITTIPISKEFHDWLKGKGKKGESYEDVIKRLIKPEFHQELEGSDDSHDTSSGEEDSHESSSDEVEPF